jgi:hypothetical protein
MYNFDPDRRQYADAYRMAEKRVKEKVGFYWHLASYLVVNGFLVAIYLLTSMANGDFYYPWPIWPMLGWGIGLLLHFLGVFVFPDTPEARQRMVQKELDRWGVTPPPAPMTTQPPTDIPSNNHSKEEVFSGDRK